MEAKKEKEPITVGFIALGCAKNVVDSEKMLGQIAANGMVISGQPSEADVVVINTCGFIEPAKAEALDVIGEAAGWKKNGGVKKIVVAGCLSERLGEGLFKEAEGIDAVVGLGQRDKIASIIAETMSVGKHSSYMDGVTGEIHDDRGRLLITGGHRAYLRISEGCNRKCCFCTIPMIRGPFRSKPKDLVLSEAAELASSGVKELSIIAQDSTYYGKDLKIKNGLVGLLRDLEKIDGPEWIRLMYMYPSGISGELMEFMASSSKVVNYVDMPIQHISDEVLKNMRRADTKAEIVSQIEKLRAAMSDVVLRTTVIVGFPGETDEQFGELLEFIKWAKFDALGAFTFWPEDGTDSAKLDDQIDDKVKQARYDELMKVQQEIAFAKNEAKIDERIKCLVDGVDDDSNGVGRYYGQAADIDGVCIIKNCEVSAGKFVNVKIVGSEGYDLLCE